MASLRRVILSIAVVSFSIGAPAHGAIAAPGRDALSPCLGGWTNANAPATGTPATLYGVAVVPSSNPDIWAVGANSDRNRTLAEHWDGTSWSIVPSPSVYSNDFFSSVSADSDTDLWAIGLAIVERWDGSTWTVMPFPSRLLGFLSDVAAFGIDDVWVAGFTYAP